jgi:hypothetical protein
MRLQAIGLAALLAVGCSNQARSTHTHTGTPTDKNTAPGGPNADTDGDGYTPAQGDCNDSEKLVNPGALEIAGNGIDDDCNGAVDEPILGCDGSNVGQRDPGALAQAIEQCDSRFFLGAEMRGPSDPQARKVVAKFGVLQPLAGSNMVVLSTGIAADKSDPDFVEPQPGTEFSYKNTIANPAPNLMAAAHCGSKQPAKVNDYTELVVRLKVPTNVTSFSFQFQYFSAEYPEWVCTEFNDEFLVMMESTNEYAAATNIAFDMQMNPVTVNNGFFTVCENDTSQPQTQHCMKPVSDIAGTGYEDKDDLGGFAGMLPGDLNQPNGGSTGWLTTTAPVTPGESVTLHFMIFDEGDHSLDSAVLIDNFRWGNEAVTAPYTIQ